jgi:hypothetical protein
MKRLIVPAAIAAFAASAALVSAQTPAPGEVPFPSEKTNVFVYAATFSTTGEQTNLFTAGQPVLFRAFAADVKSKKVLTNKDVKFFYIAIPGQPNVKLTYGKVGSRLLWSGTWNVPAGQAKGVVPFKVLVKTKNNRYGSFVQPAVVTAMLTIT